jgi:phenol 2-monooxygenase
MFSASPKATSQETGDGIDPAEFQRYFVKQGRFTAGTATQYRPSSISAEPIYQHLAKGLTIGMRFHSAPVIRLADAKPMHLGHAFKADGRWRIIAFAGAEHPSSSETALWNLCDFLAKSQQSPIVQYTPPGADIDHVIDFRVVFQQDHRLLDLHSMPALLIPQKGCYGLRDYEKIFCADLRSGEDIFDKRGIDRTGGCLVVVRPDQYVANVLPLVAHGELAAYFDLFMSGVPCDQVPLHSA